jgi:opine dehydrogenase
MVLNAGRVEDQESEFLFYIQGASPAVSRVHEALDAERVTVKKALGFNAMTLREWLIKTYDSKGVNIYEAIQNTIPYHDKTCETAPSSMTHRYIEEDLPFGVVPFTSIAKLVDVPTPTADAIIHMASLLNNKNYRVEGLNAEKMGLDCKTPEQLKKILNKTH